MKHICKTLLGLVLMVFIFGGCQDPSRPEIPEGAKVEFVWGTDPQVSTRYDMNKESDRKLFYFKLSKYLLCLESNQNENNSYSYPKGYEDTYTNFNDAKEDYLKKLCEDTFERVFGTKYYKEGTTIDDLEKWTLKARDLASGLEDPYYSQLYFLAEDIGKTNYDTTIYEKYTDYLNENSFNEVEVHNEDIKIYVYWNYSTK